MSTNRPNADFQTRKTVSPSALRFCQVGTTETKYTRYWFRQLMDCEPTAGLNKEHKSPEPWRLFIVSQD